MTVAVLPAPHAGLMRDYSILASFRSKLANLNAVANPRNLNAVYSMRENFGDCKKKNEKK